MREAFRQYLQNLYNYLPGYVFEWLGLALCIGVVVLLVLFGFKKGLKYSFKLALVEYVVLIICATVIFRTYREPQGINLIPFWSYCAILDGSTQLIYGSVMNVVVFIPLGSLLGLAFKKMNWKKVVLLGGALSILIETLQYVLERGFAEVDDVMHNIAGCLIGYGIYACLNNIISRSKRSMLIIT